MVETENLVVIANVQSTEPCWAQDVAGAWVTVAWDSASCRFDIWENGRWLMFTFSGADGRTITNAFAIEPHTCAASIAQPVGASTTWTLARDTMEVCANRLERREHSVYGPPDSVTLWSSTLYWTYRPVGSAGEIVAFTYGGVSWTYLSQGSNCCVETEPREPDPGEGF